MALGDGTSFAGNMALGAAGDPELGRAGRPCDWHRAACGRVNVNYAPV